MVTFVALTLRIAAAMLGHRSGSTPMICTFGLMVFTASAMPAMSPPPPTGTTMASISLASSRISSPTEPAPAMMLKSSNPLMYFIPSFSTYCCAAIAASAMLSPSRITLAPRARHFVIFVRGAMEGISTVTDAELGAVVGKRERVVTRRRSHHAARALFGAEGEE